MALLRIYVCSLCLLGCWGQSAAAQERVSLGISPWTHERLLFKWALPIAKHMEARSPLKVQMKSAKDLKEYYERAKNAEYDGLIAPLHMGLVLVKSHGFQALMWAKVEYNVMIVCDQSLAINALDQLDQQEIHFPSMYATTSLILLADLSSAGVNVNPVLHKNQWKVVEQLHSGGAKCAGLLSNLYESQKESFKARFNVVYRNPMKLDALVVSPPNIASHKQQAFLSLASEYAEPGIVKRFEVVKGEEIRHWHDTLNAALALFKIELSKESVGGAGEE